MSATESCRPSRVPSYATLFMLCFKVGVLSFGGGLSGWLYQEFVLKREFVSDEDFSTSLAISQMLPGANVVNLVICLGEQLRGPMGSVVCVFSFLIGPFFAVIGLYKLFDLLAGYELLPIVFNGVAFSAIGLLLLTSIQGSRRAIRFPPAMIVIGLTAFLVGVLEWPLIPVVLAIAPFSIALAWKRR